MDLADKVAGQAPLTIQTGTEEEGIGRLAGGERQEVRAEGMVAKQRALADTFVTQHRAVA